VEVSGALPLPSGFHSWFLLCSCRCPLVTDCFWSPFLLTSADDSLIAHSYQEQYQAGNWLVLPRATTLVLNYFT